MPNVADAVDAIRNGELVIYPTETVYGLGADALDPDAVARVFEAKGRSRDKPISLAVPDVEAALGYTDPTGLEQEFMHEFLPGPVTVLVERRETVPDILTAGREQVGVRVPDHDLALEFLDAAGAVTATSANRSGRSNARRAGDVDPEIRKAASVVLDGGETPGGESTVVDPGEGVVHRAGADADRVEAWLEERA